MTSTKTTGGTTKDFGRRIREASLGLRRANYAMDTARTADEFTAAQRRVGELHAVLAAYRDTLFEEVG